MCILSQDTPIYDELGNKNEAKSFASVQENIASKSQADARRFHDKVIAYAQEWEKIIIDRVDADIKKEHERHARLEHYESKVEKLRHRAHQMQTMENKGPIKLQCKLDRNEEELRHAWQEHEAAASDCAICWKK
jgi:hypothetical protein